MDPIVVKAQHKRKSPAIYLAELLSLLVTGYWKLATKT
jgi:hypothetical protein